jgi:hypothetical protein
MLDPLTITAEEALTYILDLRERERIMDDASLARSESRVVGYAS